ncbi:MAG: choline-sulfatase [Alphaproteobacteria bacterium]
MSTARIGSMPNIVLIMADQLTPFATGAYGHPLVKTPAIDALAARGVRFDSAYTNAPLCAPSRFAFMSGQHVTRIAAYDNASEFPSAIPTFAHALRQLGYHTCLSGKMHFVGPDQLHGFNERITTDIYPADFAWTPDWELPDERIDKWYHNMDSVVEAGVAATTFQIEYDEEVGFFAERKIFDYARSAGDQPFMMVVSFIHPHDPYVALQKWWDLYDHEAIDMPTVPALPMDKQDAHSRRVLTGIEADVDIATDAQIRNARHAYYANTSYVDHWIGRITETLRAAELIDNTIVIVTSDHGDMLGERGLWYKMNFFEWSCRVPLIMAGPGLPSARAVGNNVSLVDIFPTLVEAAGGTNSVDDLDGRSLWGLATGTVDPADDVDEAIAEYCAECASHPCFMIRRGPWKYIHCDVDPPLLFNVEDDPDELTNLAADPEHNDMAQAFADEVGQRWDSGAIRKDVIATQKKRRAVYEAMQDGTLTSWDFQPKRDAANEYVRNHMDWTVAAAKSRFPPYRGEGGDG